MRSKRRKRRRWWKRQRARSLRWRRARVEWDHSRILGGSVREREDGEEKEKGKRRRRKREKRRRKREKEKEKEKQKKGGKGEGEREREKKRKRGGERERGRGKGKSGDGSAERRRKRKAGKGKRKERKKGERSSKKEERAKLLIAKAFEDSDGTYGYRRVAQQLARWGVQEGRSSGGSNRIHGDQMARGPRGPSAVIRRFEPPDIAAGDAGRGDGDAGLDGDLVSAGSGGTAGSRSGGRRTGRGPG